MNTNNIFCYIPVYIDYKKIRDFLNFYSGKDLGTVYHSGGTYNAIPVYVDFKRSNPDAFKRSVAMLQKLKKEFIKEGFYPIYGLIVMHHTTTHYKFAESKSGLKSFNVFVIPRLCFRASTIPLKSAINK